MAPVESFIPYSESKQTTEKLVKEKPKVEDLTKIERPGKPMSASMLEDIPKKKPVRKRKKSEKASNIKIENPKRDSILIITEKPQAAMKIASALGNAKKYTENRVSYYEVSRNNEKIVVASAVGHLFNLTYSKGQTGWPIFKMEWVPSYTKATYTKAYYNLLKKLSNKAKSFIVATDYDIEGEVIGWNILRFIAKQDDAKRMKYSTLTKPELVKSYENPLPTLDWGQAYAGEARHEVDWLYGINLSRALMAAIKRTGSFKLLSIGRVQGPALKIIVEREKEIQNFKSEPYWQVFARVNDVLLKHPKDIFDKSELKEFENLKEGDATTKESEESILPPHPFDLTSLQREAYNWHRISPSRTLQIAQSLYLDGLISYPRTSSQKIPKEINPRQILNELSKNFSSKIAYATRKNPVEGSKSDPAHPSIYPTGEFKRLSEDEEKIYKLILKRFISCFCEDARIMRKRISLISEGKNFTASGANIIEKGWMNVYPAKLEEQTLPDINGHVNIDEIKFQEKETQPPKRYTPASLVTILEKKGLGTKTTRSLIIDTLFNRGYLDGKSIQATPLGIKLIETVEKHSPIIIDENLTRDLERKMEDIQGDNSPPNVLKEKREKIVASVEKLITDISKEFKANEIEIGKSLLEGTQELRELQKEQNTIMPCPVCKLGNLTIKYSKKTSKYFVACDKYPDCKTTYNLPPNSMIKTTGKTNEEGLPILIALKKGKRPWEFPFNPNWKPENKS
ncbi:DNA topoisomerase I [Candidatus Pacearchaeota archaeon CG10_big_fil_rev_8_21_14_0_10_34_76]|nr:MAG: DNA topoisomerase I [Candidatus Pacearchaeota archaeon CG10_big_fil_rev_8_21_14_0_10_34_76]